MSKPSEVAMRIAEKSVQTVLGFGGLDDLSDLAPDHPNVRHVVCMVALGLDTELNTPQPCSKCSSDNGMELPESLGEGGCEVSERIQCDYDPRELAGQPIGMFHCPRCGDMVLAGLPHPPPDDEEEEDFDDDDDKT